MFEDSVDGEPLIEAEDRCHDPTECCVDWSCVCTERIDEGGMCGEGDTCTSGCCERKGCPEAELCADGWLMWTITE